MYRLAICGLAAVLATAAARAAEAADPAALAVPPDQAARARQLVRQLGSEVYLDRDKAARELARMGRLALPALDAARDDPDPEVRSRVSALLPRAEAEDLRAKLAAFLADADGRYVHDLPVLQKFRLIAGDDRGARDLFVEIVKNRANHELLLALRGAPADRLAGLAALTGSVAAASPERPPAAELAAALTARRWQMQVEMNQHRFGSGGLRPFAPEPADIALLLLAESLAPESRLPANPFAGPAGNFLFRDDLRPAAAGEGKYGPAFRRLLVHWLDTRDGPLGMTAALNLAVHLRMDPRSTARYAARLLGVEGVYPFSRAQAATQIARHGAREHLLALTRLFADDTVLLRGAPNNPQADVQVRDVALAMALLLSGQEPERYGLTAQFRGNTDAKFQYTNYRFQPDGPTTAEAKRAAAFAKWREWEAGLHGAAAGGPAAAAVVAKRYPDKAEAR